MLDQPSTSPVARNDISFGERLKPQILQPIAGALIEHATSGATFAVFNFSGTRLTGPDGTTMESIIPFNHVQAGLTGLRKLIASDAAKSTVLTAMQQLAAQPFFRKLIDDGALIAFIGTIESDIGYALAEEVPQFMKSLGASTFTQAIIRAIEAPTVWDNETMAGHAVPTIPANIRALISGAR